MLSKSYAYVRYALWPFYRCCECGRRITFKEPYVTIEIMEVVFEQVNTDRYCSQCALKVLDVPESEKKKLENNVDKLIRLGKKRR